MRALILAAGYATRLYPLTREFPKPLLEVGGKPLLDHIIAKIEGEEQVKAITVITNNKFFPQFKEWAAKRKFARPLNLVDDKTLTLDDRLGAIGDMHFAILDQGLQEDLLVLGGDNLFDTPLKGFLDFAKSKDSPVIGVYDIREKSLASQYGVIGLDADSRVVDFEEKPKTPKYSQIAMCLYYFPKAKLGLIGEYAASRPEKRDATGFYIDWLRKREPVYGYVFEGRWFDIGDPRYYNEAKERFNQ